MVDLGRRRGLLGQTGAEELLGDRVPFGGVLSVREALFPASGLSSRRNGAAPRS